MEAAVPLHAFNIARTFSGALAAAAAAADNASQFNRLVALVVGTAAGSINVRKKLLQQLALALLSVRPQGAGLHLPAKLSKSRAATVVAAALTESAASSGNAEMAAAAAALRRRWPLAKHDSFSDESSIAAATSSSGAPHEEARLHEML